MRCAFLETVSPEGLNRVGSDEWEEFELAVDSGASETVVPEDLILSAETVDGVASRRGVQYEVANGVKLPNLGEKKFIGTTSEGIQRKLTAQVCNVNKGLLSVMKVVKAGHRVVFDADGSYIQDKRSGEYMQLTEKNGLYMLRMWTKGQGF